MSTDQQLQQQESKKRKREIFFVLGLSILFFALTYAEIKLYGISQQLPFIYSIFFFGLVNFNIIILLLLLFFIFRNLVKVYLERRSRIFGSSLKIKLIAAFITFSTIPTVLLFFISVFYINSSFEKWFNAKTGAVLKSSLEVTNSYYFSTKKRNYHFAHLINEEISNINSSQNIKKTLEDLTQKFNLDAIEYYPSLLGSRLVVLNKEESVPQIPAVALDFKQKGIVNKSEDSFIHQFGEGNLVRVMVPTTGKRIGGIIVVSTFVPLSLLSKMNDVSKAYEEFRDVNPLEYPLKSIYMVILFLMSLVILMSAIWIGFYLAKQLSIPLVQLGRATKRVAGGDYSPLQVKTGSEEISNLVENFNQMTSNLANSQNEIKEANEALTKTLSNLNAHSRYIEIVLSNVSAGVVSVDKAGYITTLNKRAAELLKISTEDYIGKSVRELLDPKHLSSFIELAQYMDVQKIESVQRETVITIHAEEIPLSTTLSNLRNEQGDIVGKILVFDDLTHVVNAQRAVAWSEVAKRIAHEIKNPLTPIQLSAERLQRKFSEQITDPIFNECTQMIISQTVALKNLVNEFNQFARLPEVKPVLGDFNEMVAESVKIYKNSQPQIVIQDFLDSSLPKLKFDEEQMKRCLINILDNAVAALLNVKDAKISINTLYDRKLNLLRLTVTDNGQGIKKEHKNRIFEPYFSTKSNGTGLGLSIVKRIVEDHSGFIRVLSDTNQGTQFLIEIPISV